MKNFLKSPRFVTILILCIVLSACGSREYESKADYFDGAVIVEYYQTMQNGSDDSLTMTFNEKGTYHVYFSYTKGYENNRYNKGRATLPEDFTIVVGDSPKSKVITQYVLPGFLTVAIAHGDETESHDFK